MSEEFRQGVRIANTDLDGTFKVPYALVKIKGIGLRLANTIVKKAGVDPDVRLGYLSDGKIDIIKDIIGDLSNHDIRGWLLNRRKDIETGEDIHCLGSALILQIKTDIDQMKKIRSWRGFRHSYGLKVRGQRTKTTGRGGRAVGVRVRKQRAR